MNRGNGGRSEAQLLLPLSFGDGEAAASQRLLERLTAISGGRIRAVVLTENRSTILTALPDGERAERLRLRIHRCFVSAPDPVLTMVSAYAAGRPRRPRSHSLDAIRRYFDSNTSHEPIAPRRLPLRPLGCVYDLAQLRDELNRRYFDDALDVGITWGRNQRLSRRRRGSVCVQLGSYCWDDNLIRVHPVLDRAEVPAHVVASVVHHEMVHATVPPRVVGRRRYVHTREFRRREAEFQQLAAAQRWIDRHLFRLLETRRA